MLVGVPEKEGALGDKLRGEIGKIMRRAQEVLRIGCVVAHQADQRSHRQGRQGCPRTPRLTMRSAGDSLGHAVRVLLLAAALAASARAVAPVFTTTEPAGGRRGATLDVRLRGERLGDVEEVLFYDSGIRVEGVVTCAER